MNYLFFIYSHIATVECTAEIQTSIPRVRSETRFVEKSSSQCSRIFSPDNGVFADFARFATTAAAAALPPTDNIILAAK